VYDILIASIYIYNWLLVHQFPVLPYQMCYLYPEILLTSEKSQDVKKHESLNSKTHTHQVVFFFCKYNHEHRPCWMFEIWWKQRESIILFLVIIYDLVFISAILLASSVHFLERQQSNLPKEVRKHFVCYCVSWRPN
jgi:hypothetical protein